MTDDACRLASAERQIAADFNLIQLGHTGHNTIAPDLLQLFRLFDGYVEADREVVREMVAADRQYSRMRNRSLEEDHHLCGAGSYIRNADSELTFVRAENRLSRGNALIDRVQYLKAGL